MLKLFGGGGGNTSAATGKSRWQGKTFRVQQYHVTVEDALAEGGFALVFQVKAGRGQRYALKRMAVNSEQDLHLAKQEVAITKALSDCPHSVTFLASSISLISADVHEVLILLQLYTGGRLVDVMNSKLKSRSSRFTEEEVLKIFTDICQAVARLHHRTKPIIHRDIKVENVLLDSAGNYVLCDYGSCTIKSMHPELLGATECEEEISRFTTMAYRAPEMVSLYSGKSITAKSDIWALGCFLYKLCFFTTPFGEQPLAIVSGTFTIPEDSKFSSNLHSLICYMLETDPLKRPNIWQISEATFKLMKTNNPIHNAFHSPPPPSSLPLPQRSKDSKVTPPRPPIAKATSSEEVMSRSRHPVDRTSSFTPSGSSHLKPSTASRERPRARRRAPSPHITIHPSHLSHHPHSSHLSPSTAHDLAKSLDSGLNLRGSVSPRPSSTVQRHTPSSVSVQQDNFPSLGSLPLDQFGQPHFTPQATPPCDETKVAPRDQYLNSRGAERSHYRCSSVPTFDEFGQTPFVKLGNHAHPSDHSSDHSGDHAHIRDHSLAVDEFGSPAFTASSYPSLSQPTFLPSHPHSSHPHSSHLHSSHTHSSHPHSSHNHSSHNHSSHTHSSHPHSSHPHSSHPHSSHPHSSHPHSSHPHSSHPHSSHPHSSKDEDLFGARPFAHATDAFGDTHFST